MSYLTWPKVAEKKGSHKADLALVPDLGMVVAWKKYTPTC